ncbi:MAG: imidazolonepropionase [Gemmatimonadota bacterium]|nr:imidazolonepropionase [Gemmatimonadota bacterium]MDP6803339.1 imidazolonepropionase [Gemmatimonadota bacterium]MDP7031479.1 imidazolonepropionase [Gemmatimonadota bacterium]
MRGTANADLVIENAAEVLTLEEAGATVPRRREDLRRVGSVREASVACAAGEILWAGPAGDLEGAVEVSPGATRIDASGCTVTPGFVDSHTHLAFGGSRHDEFERRLLGQSYLEIAAAGGGIRSSVRHTRAASEDELVRIATRRLDLLLLHGTTTVECKSGYGLSTEHELKQLRALSRASAGHPVDTVATFLGAHEFPEEFAKDHEAYVRLLMEEMIPAVAESGLAEYADVFCEEGVYTVDQARRVMQAAAAHGMKPRIHADEFAPSGAAELAVELGAKSADHLSAVSDAGVRALAGSDTVGTVLPGTTFSLRIPGADARRLIDEGVALAIATDLNPGSCAVDSMGVVIGLACLHLGMTPSEAFSAATVNAAYALDRADRIGSMAPGKQADLLVLDTPDYRCVPYRFGTNLVRDVVKSGSVVVRGGRRV